MCQNTEFFIKIKTLHISDKNINATHHVYVLEFGTMEHLFEIEIAISFYD